MVKSIPTKFKVARIKAGLYQRDLAQQVGITSNALSQIETGHKSTTGKTASAICSVLGVHFDEIFIIEQGGGNDGNMREDFGA